MEWENLDKKSKIIISFVAVALVVFGLGLFLFYDTDSDLPASESQLVFSKPEISEIDQGDSSQIYFVEITGYVVRPGIYELDRELMVLELIEIAGGVTAEADKIFLHKDLGLSTIISPQQKIYIPSVSENYKSSQSTTSSSAIINKVSINNSSLEQLTTLKGIGPATATKIIENRPYEKLEELLKVSGIGQAIYNNIVSDITL